MSVPTTGPTKNRRINLRASERQEAMLRHAAEAADTSVTEFVLGSAIARAEQILADRRLFVATPEQYDRFVALLDAPVATDRLAKLFAQDSIFDRPFDLDDR